MRITMLAVGSRGDVQPFLALGLGLQARGHTVCLATHAIFRSLIRERGLDFHPIAGDPKAMLQSQAGEKLRHSGRHPLRFIRAAIAAFEPILMQLAEDCWAACQRTDAIIYSPFTFFGYDIAEKLAVPCIVASLQPALRTRWFPSPAFPQGWRLGGSYNWLTHLVSEQSFWMLIQPYLNRWRADQLKLPTRSLRRIRERVRGLTLFGYSPSVLPKPPDWSELAHVTGYWFLDRADTWEASGGLTAFLSAGPPPVCVGFGSMLGRDAKDLTRIVVEALSEAEQRGIIITGWGGLAKMPLPASIHVADFVPFDWLFPQVSAVVHHGGAGTMAAALRAGKPVITCPVFGDQPFWGELATRLGVGPKPMPLRRLSAAGLLKAIRVAVHNEKMRRSAIEMGERIRSEDGVAESVGLIDAYFSALASPKSADPTPKLTPRR